MEQMTIVNGGKIGIGFKMEAVFDYVKALGHIHEMTGIDTITLAGFGDGNLEHHCDKVKKDSDFMECIETIDFVFKNGGFNRLCHSVSRNGIEYDEYAINDDFTAKHVFLELDFLGMPWEPEQEYKDLHTNKKFKLRDYHVVRVYGVYFIVSPYFSETVNVLGYGSIMDFAPVDE